MKKLFEVLRYGNDKEKLREIMTENSEAYSNMDSDTRELLEVVAKIKMKEEEQIMKKEEKTYDMCKAFLDMKLEGIEEGEILGSRKRLVKTVCIKLQKNKPEAIIADELEEELPMIEKIVAIQKQLGTYNVDDICKVLSESI